MFVPAPRCSERFRPPHQRIARQTDNPCVSGTVNDTPGSWIWLALARLGVPNIHRISRGCLPELLPGSDLPRQAVGWSVR